MIHPNNTLIISKHASVSIYTSQRFCFMQGNNSLTSHHPILRCTNSCSFQLQHCRTALPLLLQRRQPCQHRFHSGVRKRGLRRKNRSTIPHLSTNASLRKVKISPIRDASPLNGALQSSAVYTPRGRHGGHKINSPNINR